MSRMDLREALAGLLTLSMFIMLGNMIKKDHFDSLNIDLPTISVSQETSTPITRQSLTKISHLVKDPLKESGEGLKPCWIPPPQKKTEKSTGFITFSLTNGPEYHISQIADAVVVARYLGATLVLPDIKDSKFGYSMNLGDIYDVQNVLNGLDGLVKVTSKVPNTNPPTIKVPNMVSDDYIVKKILPTYRAKGVVKIESYFPSVINTTMARNNNNKMNMDSITCKAMFGTLKLQPHIQEAIDSTVQKLQTWSKNLKGNFIAVDLRTEVFGKECTHNGRDYRGRKVCFQAQEIGEFLKKIGFGQDTVIYVTQNKWGGNLNALKDMFPKTYTKETVMPTGEKEKFDGFLTSEFEKIMDFYICWKSEIFVPSSVDSIFYTSVVGMRIATGKTQILVPNGKQSLLALPSDYISSYVSHKNHFAYSCFC